MTPPIGRRNGPVSLRSSVRSVPGAVSVLLVVSAASVGIAVSNAGGATPKKSTSYVSACRVVDTATSLLVVRQVPPNPTSFSFPAVVPVRHPSTAREVARALCALPVMPSGVFHCPADLGPTYWLYFAAPHVRVTKVDVDATGCETVKGLGTTRWIARSPGFWKVVGGAMKITAATQSTFAGHLKGGG